MGWMLLRLAVAKAPGISQAIAHQRPMTSRSRATVVDWTPQTKCSPFSTRSTNNARPLHMAVDEPGVSFDPDLVLAMLERHGVEYLLVGGLAARAYGAIRQTADVDCVPHTTLDNLDRVAAALTELNARLRVGGLSDEEARRLPVRIDARTLMSFGSSTWMTDAGPVDLLVELRDREGGRHDYADLVARSARYDVGDITVRLASLDDIVASKEFAGRDKDRQALPELNEILRRQQPD